MKPVVIRRENALGKMLQRPGGILASDAWRKADENLETIRDDCLATIDRRLAEIEQLHRSRSDRPSDNASRLHAAAYEIKTLAGVFGHGALGEGAGSLSELVERMTDAGGWNVAAIDVHVHALRRLRQDQDDASSRAVLAGLRQISARVRFEPPKG